MKQPSRNKLFIPIILLLAFFVSCPPPSHAETNPVCSVSPPGPDPLKSIGIVWPYEHTINSARVRIFVHRVYEPEPDGIGDITDAEIDALLSEMDAVYNPLGIFFDEIGRGNVTAPSPEAYDNPENGDGDWILGFRNENPHDNALDIYFFGIDTAVTAGHSLVTYGPTAGNPNYLCLGIWGKYSSAQPAREQLLIHEMGHSLGLYHTFEAGIAGQDDPLNPDCANRGDLVCDTPQDNLSIKQYHFDSESCTLDSVYYNYWQPVLGYNVDITNYMSYYVPCISRFTAGQVNRMFATIEADFNGIGAVITPVVYEIPENLTAVTGLAYTGTPYSSVVWDYNNDNKKDLFISISEDDSRLYSGDYIQPDGAPKFVEFPHSSFSDGVPQAGLRGVAVGDLDNTDGKTDLFAAHATDSRLYRWDGSNMVNLDPFEGMTDIPDAVSGSWGDLNGDGNLDLFVGRAPAYIEDPPNYGEPKISAGILVLSNTERASGEREFSPTPGSGLPVDLASNNSTWGDFDDDGDADLFVGALKPQPGSRLYENEEGSFTDQTVALLGTGVLDKVVASAWVDFNNDGKLDLVLARFGHPDAVFYQTQAGGFDDGSGGPAPFEFGPTFGFSGMLVYDYDNDGWQDFLGLSNDDDRSPELFQNISESLGQPGFLGLSTSVGLDIPGYVRGGVAEDFGGPGGTVDGIVDLYLGRPKSSNAFFFKGSDVTNGSPARFAKIRLNGAPGVSSKTGIGAKVTIQADSHQQVQIVDGGSLRAGQSSNDLIFGLGDYSDPIKATVVWPSGFVQADVPVVADGLTVISDSPVSVVEGSVASSYSVNPNGLVDWTFSWETNNPSDPNLDFVIFDIGNIPYQVTPAYTAFSKNTTGSVHVYSAKPGGGFTHVLTLTNQSCIPRCTLPFWVRSGIGSQTDTSDTTTDLRIRVCLGL